MIEITSSEMYFSEAYLRELSKAAQTALEAMGCAQSIVNILITDNETIRRLNRQFRNLDRPTDVLSFPSAEGQAIKSDKRFLGDIVISYETARTQAAQIGQCEKKELVFLEIHGILHLLGFDHNSFDEESKMFDKQKNLVEICCNT